MFVKLNTEYQVFNVKSQVIFFYILVRLKKNNYLDLICISVLNSKDSCHSLQCSQENLMNTGSHAGKAGLVSG